MLCGEKSRSRFPDRLRDNDQPAQNTGGKTGPARPAHLHFKSTGKHPNVSTVTLSRKDIQRYIWVRLSPGHCREHENQGRVPVDRHLIARVRFLFIQVHPGRWKIGQSAHRGILLRPVRSTGEQSRPGLGIFIGTAGPVMRMTVGIGADSRNPRQRESVAPEQIVQVIQRRLEIARIRLDYIGDK